jgi:hypothetical protein
MNDPVLPPPDQSGQAQLIYWIAVAEAAALFAEAKMPRNTRTIRRYCMRGDLECRKTENALHQPQYFISKASVETYIAQQQTLLAGRPDRAEDDQISPDRSGQDRIGPDAPDQGDCNAGDNADHNLDVVMSGEVRAGPDRSASIRHGNYAVMVDQLEERIKDKNAEIAFLRGELLHRRTTDTALHDVIAAFRANAEAQRLAAAPRWPSGDHPPAQPGSQTHREVGEQGTSEAEAPGVV